MTMTNAVIHPARQVPETGLGRTARTTGMLYFCFFVMGIAGSVVVRSQLFAADDPAATLSNLTERASLARLGIVLELGIVLAQALTAVWFYRLFRSVDGLTSGVLTAFGMVNAVRSSAARRCSPRHSRWQEMPR